MGKKLENIKEISEGLLAAGYFASKILTFPVTQSYSRLRSGVSRRLVGLPKDGVKRHVGARVSAEFENNNFVLSPGDKDYLTEFGFFRPYIFVKPVIRILGEVVGQGVVYDCLHMPIEGGPFNGSSVDGENYRSGLDFGVRRFWDYVPLDKNDLESVKEALNKNCRPKIEEIFRDKYDFDISNIDRI